MIELGTHDFFDVLVYPQQQLLQRRNTGIDSSEKRGLGNVGKTLQLAIGTGEASAKCRCEHLQISFQLMKSNAKEGSSSSACNTYTQALLVK